jgi:hypothetical protein
MRVQDKIAAEKGFTKGERQMLVEPRHLGKVRVPLEMATLELANEFAHKTKQAAVPVKGKPQH